MAVDLKTAGSAKPGAQTPTQLTTSEAPLYTCSAGTAFLGELYLTNVTGGDASALVSLVKSGGTAIAGNRIIARTLAGGETVVLKVQLNEGDFLSGLSDTATAISVIPDGTVFADSSGATLSGIQFDADGTPGRGSAGSATGTSVKIGTSANRRLLAALMVQFTAGSPVGWASYTGGGPTMACTDGAMTRLVSIDFNTGAGVSGSTHIFERVNPTSGSTQAVTGAAAATGATLGLLTGARAYSGVASVTGAVSVGPVGAAALSLPITSAVGHVPFFAGSFFAPPIALGATGLRVRYFDGITSGFTIPQWLAIADALGVASLTATTSNSTQHACVAVDMVPV